jgi:hypothetical protein
MVDQLFVVDLPLIAHVLLEFGVLAFLGMIRFFLGDVFGKSEHDIPVKLRVWSLCTKWGVISRYFVFS